MSQTNNLHVAGFLVASALSLGLVGPAFAQYAELIPNPLHLRGQFGVPMPPGRMPFLRDLPLTDAQEDQVFKIFHDQMPIARERIKAVQRASEEIDGAARTENFNRSRIRELTDTHAKAISDMTLMRVEVMSRVREILTPEQRIIFDDQLRRSPQPRFR